MCKFALFVKDVDADGFDFSGFRDMCDLVPSLHIYLHPYYSNWIACVDRLVHSFQNYALLGIWKGPLLTGGLSFGQKSSVFRHECQNGKAQWYVHFVGLVLA